MKAIPKKLVIGTKKLAISLGLVIEKDQNNKIEIDQKFCVTLLNQSLYILTIRAFNLVTRKTKMCKWITIIYPLIVDIVYLFWILYETTLHSLDIIKMAIQ